MSKKLSTKLSKELNLIKESILKKIISKLESLDYALGVRTNSINNSYEELLKLSFSFNKKIFFLDGISKEEGKWKWVVWFAETTKEYFELVGTTKQDEERLDVLLSELETFGHPLQELSSEDLITILSTIEEYELSLK